MYTGEVLKFGSDGMFGQQLETIGLSMRDFSPKEGAIQWEDKKKKKKKKKGSQTMRIRQILTNFESWQNTNLDTFLTKILAKC